jgi:hypothetical protein
MGRTAGRVAEVVDIVQPMLAAALRDRVLDAA